MEVNPEHLAEGSENMAVEQVSGRFVRSLIVMFFWWALVAMAQDEHGFTPADIERGQQIFFNTCAGCHGPDGDGVAGVNLGSGKFRKASTDRDLIQIIRNGLPGTEMPPSSYSEAQAGMIVAYLHSMASAAVAKTATPLGDAARGKRIVENQGGCLKCHRIGESGGFLGPELSAIGSGRRSSELQDSLLTPDAQIRPDNRTVRVVEKNGASLVGRLLNQDTYSIQLIDAQGRLRSFVKLELRDFEIQRTSAMPSYAKTFSSQELADVVSFLVSLKGRN